MTNIVRRVATPWHLWLVGGLALLWNGFGAFDFTMTLTRGAEYLRSMGMNETMVAYFDTLPSWLYVPWGLGVWGGVIAALFLLLRKKAAVGAYALSLAGAVGSHLVQKFGFPQPTGEASSAMNYMPYVIIALAVFQWFYANRMKQKSVLD